MREKKPPGQYPRCLQLRKLASSQPAFVGCREPTILRAAPAIASLIRQFEDRYLKSCATMKDHRTAQDSACQPKNSNGSPPSRILDGRPDHAPTGVNSVSCGDGRAGSLATGKSACFSAQNPGSQALFVRGPRLASDSLVASRRRRGTNDKLVARFNQFARKRIL